MYPQDSYEVRAVTGFLDRQALNDGLRLWLASERMSFTADRRCPRPMVLTATAVVINTFSIRGGNLCNYASDILNATDVFSNIIVDEDAYQAVALNVRQLPMRLQIPVAGQYWQAALISRFSASMRTCVCVVNISWQLNVAPGQQQLLCLCSYTSLS